jgi:hypothetical protein
MAGAASAATITVADLGAPDFTGLGDQEYPTLNRWMFTAANDVGDGGAQLNAVEIDVSVTDGNAHIHQLFKETGPVLGQYTYNDTPKLNDVVAVINPLDTFLADALFTLTALEADEDIDGLIEDVGGPQFTGPHGPAQALAQTADLTSGYGTFFEYAGAVAGGSEADSYDVLHLVLPSTLLLDAPEVKVIVTIKATGSGITQFAETFEFGVPEPATMSLLAIGGIALLRRRR